MHSAPYLKWLAQCDVHKLTLEKKNEHRESIEYNMYNTLFLQAFQSPGKISIKNAWDKIMDAIHIFAVGPHSHPLTVKQFLAVRCLRVTLQRINKHNNATTKKVSSTKIVVAIKNVHRFMMTNNNSMLSTRFQFIKVDQIYRFLATNKQILTISNRKVV